MAVQPPGRRGVDVPVEAVHGGRPVDTAQFQVHAQLSAVLGGARRVGSVDQHLRGDAAGVEAGARVFPQRSDSLVDDGHLESVELLVQHADA